MYNKNTTAFIPLRGGSKGIPNKNIKNFCGKPLCYWSIKAANDSKSITKIIISTDNQEISTIVKNFNFDKVSIFERSKESATDTASTELSLIEYLESDNSSDNIILIQATNPFVSSSEIDSALSIYEKGNYDSLLSVVKQHRFYWERGENGSTPINYLPESRPRRQDWSGTYVENGSFYISSKEKIISTKCRISGEIDIFEMNEYSYYEIDSSVDWIIAENLFIDFKKKYLFDNYDEIKLFVMDVDGVLTDAGMYYTEKNDEIKKFNTRDGKGIELLKKSSLEVAIITSENTEIVKRRAEKLNIKYVFQGVHNKLECLKSLLRELNLELHNVAYIGDDINDYEVLSNVGFPITPSDGIKRNKSIAKYICKKSGGEGCVREACDLILEQVSFYKENNR